MVFYWAWCRDPAKTGWAGFHASFKNSGVSDEVRYSPFAAKWTVNKNVGARNNAWRMSASIEEWGACLPSFWHGSPYLSVCLCYHWPYTCGRQTQPRSLAGHFCLPELKAFACVSFEGTLPVTPLEAHSLSHCSCEISFNWCRVELHKSFLNKAGTSPRLHAKNHLNENWICIVHQNPQAPR